MFTSLCWKPKDSQRQGSHCDFPSVFMSSPPCQCRSLSQDYQVLRFAELPNIAIRQGFTADCYYVNRQKSKRHVEDKCNKVQKPQLYGSKMGMDCCKTARGEQLNLFPFFPLWMVSKHFQKLKTSEDLRIDYMLLPGSFWPSATQLAMAKGVGNGDCSKFLKNLKKS